MIAHPSHMGHSGAKTSHRRLSYFGPLLLIASLLSNGCVSAPTTPLSPSGSRFVRNKNEPAVLVFVHGVLGNASTTWTNQTTHAYFPDLVANSDDFHGVDIYV